MYIISETNFKKLIFDLSTLIKNSNSSSTAIIVGVVVGVVVLGLIIAGVVIAKRQMSKKSKILLEFILLFNKLFL